MGKRAGAAGGKRAGAQVAEVADPGSADAGGAQAADAASPDAADAAGAQAADAAGPDAADAAGAAGVADGWDAGPFIHAKGMRFPRDDRIIPPKRRRLLREGRYEEKEHAAIMAALRPDDVVIELGAGIGYISTAVARKGARAVHTFEANPAMIPYIRTVHRLNGVADVALTHAVLGASAGRVPFYVRRDFTASSLDADPDRRKSPAVAVEEVEMLDIRAVFAEIAPTFLVCDIEGAEADLIPAADLSGLRCAVVELHPQWIGAAGVAAVFGAMAAAGLTYFPRGSQGKVVTFRRHW